MNRELNTIFDARLKQAQELLTLSQTDAIQLLNLIFERATSPELMAILHREYLKSARLQGTSTTHEETLIEPPTELAKKTSKKPVQKAKQIEPVALDLPQLPEASLDALEHALEQVDDQGLDFASSVKLVEPDPPEVVEVQTLPPLDEEPKILETPWQTNQMIRQIEEIQSLDHLQELLERFAKAKDIIIKEIILSRLSHLIQTEIIESSTAKQLEDLAGEILVQIEAPLLQADLMSLLSEAWQNLLQARIERADDIESLSAIKPRLSLFWIVCEQLHFPKFAMEAVYVELVEKWLALAAVEDDLEDIELPPQFIDTGEHLHPPLQDAVLRQAVNQSWESFLNSRIQSSETLKSVKHLYESQNWDELYRPAERILHKLWDDLTQQELQKSSSFEDVGKIVLNGGSYLASQRWIEAAASWEQVSEVCHVLGPNTQKGRAHSQLVEKIFAFADTEDRIREAQSLLRNNTLSFMIHR